MNRHLLLLPSSAFLRFKASIHNRRFLPLILACLTLLSSTTAIPAQKKPASPAPPGDRFLFVVETSNAMLPFKHAGRQAVFDLIYFGVDSQLQPGDTLGLWTYGEEVHGGAFPMQIWAPDQKLQIASSFGIFLKNQKLENQARLDLVVSKLGPLIKAIKDVNILIVSSSDALWKGTPFEQDINLAYKKNAAESRSAKRPLITTLVARQGEIASWSVTLAGDPISIPKGTSHDKLVQTAPGQPPTGEPKAGLSNGAPANTSILASKSANADPAQTPAGLTPAPTPSGKPEVKKGSRIPASGAIKSIVITSKQIVTNGEPSREVAQNLVSESQPSLAAKPAAPAEEGKSLAAPAATLPEPASIPLLAPLPVAAREKPDSSAVSAPAPAPPPMAMAASPTPSFTARKWFASGAVLILLAVGLRFVAKRFLRPAPKPSFITRSIDRNKP